MSRHPIADAVLALERARDRIEPEYLVPTELVDRASKATTQQVGEVVALDRRGFEVAGEIVMLGFRLRRVITDAAADARRAVQNEIDQLRCLLWIEPPPQSAPEVAGTPAPRPGGHLRVLPESGEPQLMRGWRYEPAPLVMPESIEVGIAVQGKLFDCYFVAVVNAVARSNPDALRRMVRQDPDDENIVIVDVAGGSYRLDATLPVDETSGMRAGATSRDGSTLAAYLEKAAAAHFGSWADLEGGPEIYALGWLVGDSHPSFNFYTVDKLTDEDIRQVVASPSTAAVGYEAGDDPAALAVLSRANLAVRHAYTIVGTTPDGRVRLHNPYGELQPKSLSIQDLRTLNMELTWAGEPRRSDRSPEETEQ